MPFLARKIEQSKWRTKTTAVANISADAITSCLILNKLYVIWKRSLMPFLARKIEQSKWRTKTTAVAHISADAITSCLRTSRNALSVWHIEQAHDVDEAILAIVSSPNYQQLDALDIVLLDPKWFASNNLEIVEKEGISSVVELNKAHRNIIALTYSKLGMIGSLILRKVRDDCVVRKTASEITKIVWIALEKERLNFGKLNPRLQPKLVKRCRGLGFEIDKYLSFANDFVCPLCGSTTPPEAAIKQI